MRVGEVSERTGVSVRSIRYYERAGLLRATRSANGYREFEAGVVERVRAIRNLLETGFTVSEIVSLSACLQAAPEDVRCSMQTLALYRDKLAQIDAQVRTLTTLRQRIRARISGLDAPVPPAVRDTGPTPALGR